MAIVVSSGTSSFSPALSDVVIEAFSRCQIRPTSLTAQHLFDARMSANYVFSTWSNLQVNLYKVQLFSINLIQGMATYPIPQNVVTLLDSYIRVPQMGSIVNAPISFSTTAGSPVVTISLNQNGLTAGAAFVIQIPIAVGGLVLQGSYPASSIIDNNTFTITTPTNATSSVAGGGSVPVFSAVAGNSNVTVRLPNHGLTTGSNFPIQVQVNVGGLIFPPNTYSVATVVDANNFTITTTPGVQAGSTQANIAENNGQGQFQSQLATSQPTDFYLTPISRTEYSAQSNKTSQARPTTFWFDRLNPPQITFWQTPDNGGPYTYFFYAVVQNQDAVIPGGVGLDIPYRFEDAFASALAARLALKYPPPPASGITVADLELRADKAWMLASKEDVEEIPLYLFPSMDYYSRT